MAFPPRKNRILSRLSRAELAKIEPMLEPVRLNVRQRLETPNKAIQHVYFVDDGVVSVVATGPMRRTIEVGLIGWEGCSGLPYILGAAKSPLDAYVQIEGAARRIAVADLHALMAKSPELTAQLLQTAFLFQIQIAYTALANGHANLEQRLARWLLMAHDRTRGDAIKLTHEFLAIMLGVRRPGVTVSLSSLKKAGLVELRRGVVLVVDRQGLERLADKFYGPAESEMTRIDGQ